MEGKRLAGHVEIHQNGLRYQHPIGGPRSDGQSKIDILFSNVKHLFFQPSVSELIVIIHVHLINPILIGKRKAKDVQFYREATEMQFDETGTRKRKHRYGDEEEFEAEQEERRRRALLDKEFKSFAEKIADAGRNENVQVDIPFRELGFNGVPSRSSVLMQPTTDCLVQLTEPPFTVITLLEIEVVHLERVQVCFKHPSGDSRMLTYPDKSLVSKISIWLLSFVTLTDHPHTSTPFPSSLSKGSKIGSTVLKYHTPRVRSILTGP